ncbi:ATP-dependent DNA helicase RecQ [Alteribacillus persepolensis]|uniref:ATP-dependent DNA helicase RecQ n=1 Tax=Alteribacillus persepolensis TaxID=568899 RepID=A0A1G7ZJF1_9BACI|nr:ATP-dependent DNA helicase RecQ [Alteribacillus persepolensis]SDH08828.1 ATP-dependent DNA helicase RecQ [Alteribacillus persepolensis]
MLEDYLFKYFGYTSFKENQKSIIQAVLNQQDVFAMLATGSGKSLCYQLPAFINEGLTVVVSPLLALMENQVQELKQKGLKQVAAYNSFLSFQEKNWIMQHLDSYKILYISPESIQQENVCEALAKQQISLFAVDEAHCISQWGHEFRTDYLQLGKVRRALGSPPCLALTASAPPEVRDDILYQLECVRPVLFCDSIDRTNISIEAASVPTTEEKKTTLLNYVKSMPMPGMVYVSSRKKAEQLTRLMTDRLDVSAFYYHGGMTQEDRNLIQQQFLQGEVDVICCTNAFGMGINKPNIRFVIHYDYPKDLESYIQEMGRAGRDGQRSTSIILRTENDLFLPRHLIEKEFPAEEELSAVLTWWKEKSRQWDLTFLIQQCGLEEVHARFIYYYFKKWQETETASQDVDIEEVKTYLLEIIHKRKTWKYRKLRQIEQWLWSDDSCRRERLLHAFGEKQKQRLKQCCDVCGISPLRQEKGHADQAAGERTWQERLASLLHP